MTEAQLLTDIMHDLSDGKAVLKYDEDDDGRTYRPRKLELTQDIYGALDEAIPYKFTMEWDFFENWAEVDKEDDE